MKLGLVTIYNVPNFGSVLQAYATQCVLEQMGHECWIIKYKYPNKRQITHRPTLKTRLYAITSKLGLVSQQRKSNKLQTFRKHKYNFTRMYNSYEELLAENWDSYDGFVVGSDQVWNARFTKGEPAFTLSFVPSEKKCFSLASSFASNELPVEYVASFKVSLQTFDALSVRENEGVNIIRNQLGIDLDVKVCMDPTLLLDKQQWLHLSKIQKKEPKEPYILYYMWAYAFEPRPYINEVVEYFKTKIGINKVIALEGAPKTIINGTKYMNKEDSTIAEFLELFSNASLVITSSFHGTAFAINMNVPLISVVPDKGKDNRQSNLLKLVGADCCIVRIGQKLDTINPYYDAKSVSCRLDTIRQDCLCWIKSNIK